MAAYVGVLLCVYSMLQYRCVLPHKRERREEENEPMMTKNNTVNDDDYWNSVNLAVNVTDSLDALNTNDNIRVNDYTVVMTGMILIIIIKSAST